jgi:glycosyltransferase involved in cell wall biosynthesis
VADRRILYVTSSLGMGGAERQLYLLLKHMDRAAFAPTVVSLHEGGVLADPMRALGVEVVELPRRGRGDLSRLARLHRLMRRVRPDIVQTFLLADTVYGFAAARAARVPVLIASRRTDRYDTFPWHVRVANRVLWSWASAIITNSERGRELAPARLRERHVLIRNGVEPLPVRRARIDSREALGIAPDALVVGTVGRLVSAKNHRRFLDVAAAIVARRPHATFLIVGGGPLERELRAEANRRGLERCAHFAGERSDIGDLLYAMDVFLLTSDREGLCNAVMEAMDARLPCVVTDVGGNRELVEDDVTGYVCADTAALTDRVLRVLDDPLLRERLGHAGRARMRDEFSAERAARETEALYRRLAKSATGSPNPSALRPRNESGASAGAETPMTAERSVSSGRPRFERDSSKKVVGA